MRVVNRESTNKSVKATKKLSYENSDKQKKQRENSDNGDIGVHNGDINVFILFYFY